jgi:arsenate reductase
MSNAKVLFLCTGNSARSQMAEALLRHYASEHFDVYSAGLEPKGINPYTVRVMNEIGLDLSQHTSKDVFQYLGHVSFGYIITVCSNAEARCPIFPGISYRFYWPFDDPAATVGTDAEILAKFREVRDQIDQRIRDWLIEQRITPIDSTSQAA